MSDNDGRVVRNAKRLTALGIGSAAIAATFMGLGTATASAEIDEMAPRPNVTSRQALIIDQDALRRAAPGNTRGLDETRRAGRGGINAHGEVRGNVKAVPGTTAAPFNLTRKGVFRQGAPIGDW
ncbi:MAG: hypothetical protein WBB07_01015 [Mycobacterium sp.]